MAEVSQGTIECNIYQLSYFLYEAFWLEGGIIVTFICVVSHKASNKAYFGHLFERGPLEWKPKTSFVKKSLNGNTDCISSFKKLSLSKILLKFKGI